VTSVEPELWVADRTRAVPRHAVLRNFRRLRTPSKPPRERSALRLSLVDGEEITRGLAAGDSLRSIAAGRDRSPSTIRTLAIACVLARGTGVRRSPRYPPPLASDRPLLAGPEAKCARI
jgi:hypothetical protein